MATTTIIYYTNNLCPEPIFTRCQKKLVEAAGDAPIISVSQKHMELGENICVGDIGSSWMSLYQQLHVGVEAAKTDYVAMAEHDCLYHPDHFKWIPPRDDTFYYNENVYFAQWGGNHPELNGMYSTYWTERRALSQLICNRDLLLKSLQARLDLLTKYGDEVKKIYQGEPGVSKIRLAQKAAKSGKAIPLAPLLADYLETEISDVFRTEIPNLDIRGSHNFTGPKRGKNRTYELPYWGKFTSVME